VKIAFARPGLPKGGAIAVPVLEGRKFGPTATALDRRTKGALTRALEASRFQGKLEDTLAVLAPRGLSCSRVVLVGFGKAEALDALAAQRIGGALAALLAPSGDSAAALAVDGFEQAAAPVAVLAANIALGASLRGYRFDKYRTTEKRDERPSLKSLTLMVEAPAAARKAFAPLDSTARAVGVARDLVSEPANVVTPAAFAAEARALSKLGIKVEVLGVKKLRDLGLNLMLGVGQGSAHEPQLVVLHWNGAGRTSAPVAFVGKGLTFDTGGISIKPANNMEKMKYDMGGGATMLGAMRALAALKPSVPVIAVIPATENMPGGRAQKPGDVQTAMSGKTIEVINTDAEGRLILADAVFYARKLGCTHLIDAATLTGAIEVALANVHVGAFGTPREFLEKFLESAKAAGEKMWPMPMDDEYEEMIKSNIADIRNTGSGKGGGASTGAWFIKEFAEDTPWVHLDIASTCWVDEGRPWLAKGPTGIALRSIVDFALKM
jgi:leucyl aminopeptidase